MKKGHTQRQWEAKFFLCGCKCIYCEEPLTLARATKDHLIPTSRGGSDDISNIAPACFRCNVMKNNRTFEEFLKDRPAISKIVLTSTVIGLPLQQARALLSVGKSVEEKPKVAHPRIVAGLRSDEQAMLRQVAKERENARWWCA